MDDEPINFEEECMILVTEVEHWRDRALNAEKMLELERQYIEDLYELRDAEGGWTA